MRRICFYIIFAAIATLMAGCANRGVGPQGGPKDTIPPSVVKEDPLNGSLNFHDKQVTIWLNEYIQLDNVVENVLISPPQQRPPVVKAVGKRVVVTFEEDLKDSTTYSIQFGSAICDYTEKNPLTGYTFSFSTGNDIDSLSISGYVVNAADLNPVKGVTVGLHPTNCDSLETQIFRHIGKTDADGMFSIDNIHEGSYRLYALRDNSRDFRYQPGEGLAWMEEDVVPFAEIEIHSDTTWIEPEDSLGVRTIDTIITHSQTMLGPANLVLWYFEEEKVRHYFQSSSRKEPHRFELIFSAEQDEMPVFRSLPLSLIDSTRSDSTWIDWMPYAQWQANSRQDTIVCWFSDSLAIRQDTILMEMTYMKSDSVYNLESKTDTLKLIYRAPRLTAKMLEQQQKKAAERKLRITSNAKSKFEVYDTLRLKAEMPIAAICKDSLHLFQKVDTLYTPLDFELRKADSIGLTYMILCSFKPEMQYELRIDSAAAMDIYGVACDKSKVQLQLKSLDEYATLRVKLPEYDSRIRIQILDEKDKVLRDEQAQEQGTLFTYLAPKSYYMRLYIDENGDGKWTTGDWAKRRQPEPIYYYPNKLTLKANWEFEETFDHRATLQLESKPKELVKKDEKKK